MNEKLNAVILKKAADIIKNKNAIIESYIEANLATHAANKPDMSMLDMADLIKRSSLNIHQEGEDVTYTFKLKPKIKTSRIIMA